MTAEVGGFAYTVPAIRTYALRRCCGGWRATLRCLLDISNRLRAIDPCAGKRDGPSNLAFRTETHPQTGHAGADSDAALAEVYPEHFAERKAFTKVEGHVGTPF